MPLINPVAMKVPRQRGKRFSKLGALLVGFTGGQRHRSQVLSIGTTRAEPLRGSLQFLGSSEQIAVLTIEIDRGRDQSRNNGCLSPSLSTAFLPKHSFRVCRRTQIRS